MQIAKYGLSDDVIDFERSSGIAINYDDRKEAAAEYRATT